jgi:hypothetical protein
MDGFLIRGFRPLLVLVLAGSFSAASLADEKAPAEHPLVPAIKLAQSSLDTVSEAKDYTAVFFKRELLANRMLTHTCTVKVRHEPFSVYMRFLKPHDGREVIYVDGANGGNLLAHETGLASIVGTVALSPKSNEALSESRYPITDMGIKMLVKRIIEQWEAESKYGECDVKYYPQAKLDQVECKVIESTHPTPRKQFKYHITRLYIEKKSNLPIRVEQWAFPSQAGGKPVLVEEYTYSKVELDAGLADIDFDTRNPNYGY